MFGRTLLAKVDKLRLTGWVIIMLWSSGAGWGGGVLFVALDEDEAVAADIGMDGCFEGCCCC